MDVVRQADLLMARLMERSDALARAGAGGSDGVRPKAGLIESSIGGGGGGGYVLPDGIQSGREYRAPSYGSIHSVLGEGADGRSILVSRSGGVLVRDPLDGKDADVRDGDANWSNYGSRGRVPMDAEGYADIVRELDRDKEGVDPSSLVDRDRVGVWRKRGEAERAESGAGADGGVRVGSTPEGATSRFDEDGGQGEEGEGTGADGAALVRATSADGGENVAVHGRVDELNSSSALLLRRPANPATTTATDVAAGGGPVIGDGESFELDLDLDDLSALTSCGGLTRDDLTVATATLYNFLKTETENIRRMFEAERQADGSGQLRGGAGHDADGPSLAGGGGGGTTSSSSSVHSSSARSIESEKLNAAAQAAEDMVKQMEIASRWMAGEEMEFGSDEDGAYNSGNADEGNDSNSSSSSRDGSGRPLYAIHQDASLGLGNLLPDEIVAAAGAGGSSSWITWNAYHSEEHDREYYHEPRSGTTTWTKPVGVRVETSSDAAENDDGIDEGEEQAVGHSGLSTAGRSVHSNSSTRVGGVTSTTGSVTNHSSSGFKDEFVEVKDFTKTPQSRSASSTANPNRRGRSRSPGGQSVVSEVTFDDGRGSPEATPYKNRYGGGDSDERSAAALRSADEFRPDRGGSLLGSRGSSTRSLAEYRAKQRRTRRRNRRRAVFAILASVILAMSVLGWKGTVIVPYLNEVSGGALGRVLLPALEWMDGLGLGREGRLVEWAEEHGMVDPFFGGNEDTTQKMKKGASSPTVSNPPALSLKTGGATRAASSSAALKKDTHGWAGSGRGVPATASPTTGARESMEGILSGVFKRETAAKVGRAVPVVMPAKKRAAGDADTSRAAAETSDDKSINPDENTATTTAVALPNGKTEKTTTKIAEIPRRRYRLCNIPFAYVFIRRCWKESRELPINVGWLTEAMMQ